MEAKKTTKKAVPVVDKSKGLVSLTTLAREIKANPKVVRAKIRRAYATPQEKPLPKPVTKGHWNFAAKDRATILALIS